MSCQEKLLEVILLDKLSPYTSSMEVLLSGRKDCEDKLEKTSKRVKSTLDAYFSYREKAKPILKKIEEDYINGHCTKDLRDNCLNKHDTRCLKFGNEIRGYYEDINKWKKDILKINDEILKMVGMIETITADSTKEFDNLPKKSQELIFSYILEAQKIKLDAQKATFLNTWLSFLDNRFLLFSPPSAKQSKKSSLQEKLDPYPTTPKMGHSNGG